MTPPPPTDAPAPFALEGLDHLVLTVADVDVSSAFYQRVLGMREVRFGPGRVAVHFGAHKLNLHPRGGEFAPHASRPTPGSADFCVITTDPIERVSAHLQACGVVVELGPVTKTGALGAMTSLYLRDPDGNLVEVARYDEAGRLGSDVPRATARS